MIIINRKKKIEQYKFEQMPNFNHRRAAIVWYHIQQMNAELINIKSIDIQVKDVRQMIYSHNPRLVSLYARLNLIGGYSGDDYINISKYKKGNKSLIFEILNATWLLKLEDLENKTEEELEYESLCLQSRIDDMKRRANSPSAYRTEHNIKLLEYKLTCLDDYKHQRMSEQQDSQILVKKLPTLSSRSK